MSIDFNLFYRLMFIRINYYCNLDSQKVAKCIAKALPMPLAIWSLSRVYNEYCMEIYVSPYSCVGGGDQIMCTA